MTDKDLQEIVEQLSLKHFNKPFMHKAKFNSRLRTTGGRYLLHSHDIEINRKSLEKFGMKELEGIVLHELCHYHLHLEGKGYKHRDQDFKKLLKDVGAPRYCSSIVEKKSNIIYIYECKKCKQKYSRKRRMNTSKYRCGKCFGKLQFIDMKKI